MAKIKPFRCIRPTEDKAALVAALPYDVLSSEEAKIVAEGNEYSFLHVDKPEIDLEECIDVYDTVVYEKGRDNLIKMIENGILVQEEEEMLYIYRLTMGGRSQTGIVVCTDLDEYFNGTIKKHEFTIERKELDRINHVNYCDANTGPIFMAYKGQNDINRIIENWTTENEPVYDFLSDDEIGHTVWAIGDEDIKEELINLFSKIKSIYIADGHHRIASAAKVCSMRREENPEFTGEEEFNYCLSVLFPAEQLKIMDYNRVVKDLNGYTEDEFLKMLSERFEIVLCEDGIFRPSRPHDFGMYLNGKWYKITAKAVTINPDPVLILDVSILQEEVLLRILNIKDVKTDTRIDFVGGIFGAEVLEEKVDSGDFAVAFLMYPTSVKELMSISDAGKIMPPKSTWFEPKLRSGLFIHSLQS